MTNKVDLKEVIDTTSTVMENFKLLAPGTYNHCITVADLCNSVGRELDLDVENLVVAATLHDLGKINSPNLFIENVGDDRNPHEDFDPKISFQLISRHVGDSVLKLVQLGLPLKIIEIVSMHHGDTVIRSIYDKAKKVYNGSTVKDRYRYRSLKPTNVSAAILMCADVVESATRSLHINNKLDDHKEIINILIEKLVSDSQLDILRIGELRIIKNILSTEIKNMYHKRLDYDLEKENLDE